MTPLLVEILDREAAPFYVCRRVAWGKWMHDRFVRLALAMYLRRPANPHAPSHSTRGLAWPKDREAAAAERVFRASPQYVRLVKCGVLVEHGKMPSPEHMRAFAMAGQPLWDTILREVATLDRTAFVGEVNKLVAARGRRRPPRKQEPLSPDQIALLDALGTLRRAVIDGRLTADMVPELTDSTTAHDRKRREVRPAGVLGV